MDKQTYVDALRREKAGYLAKDKPDRAKEVDAELARVAKAPKENARAQAPEQA